MESTKIRAQKAAKTLESLQRRARSEQSAEVWQRYARALERLVDIPRDLPRYALVNEGDVYINNRFWSDEAIPYRAGDDRQSLLDAMLAREVKRCGQLNPILKANFVERVSDVQGAWVFDQALMDLMAAVWEADNMSRDSHYEGRDLALRTVIQAWSLKKLTLKEPIYEPKDPLPEPRPDKRDGGSGRDSTLYNLRRMAYLRGSSERWRRYARALERRKNGRDEDKGQFAVFYSYSDSNSHTIRGHVPHTPGAAMETLIKELHQNHFPWQDRAFFEEEIASQLSGAWIVDEDCLELLHTLDDANPGWDCGYDAWREAGAGICMRRQSRHLNIAR